MIRRNRILHIEPTATKRIGKDNMSQYSVNRQKNVMALEARSCRVAVLSFSFEPILCTMGDSARETIP